MTNGRGSPPDAAGSAAPGPARRRPGRPVPGGSPLGRWLAGVGRVVGALLGLLCLAGASALLLVSQTTAGRETARSLIEEALSGAVAGEVDVGPISGGNLVTRAVLRSFRIAGPDGEPFLRMQDVRVAYNPLGFLVGRYRFRRMEVGELHLSLRQGPEGDWNFDRIFAGEGGSRRAAAGRPADGAAPGAERPEPEDGIEIAAADVTVRDGSVAVRTPWEDDGGAGRRSGARSAAAGGGEIWRVERNQGGRPWRVIAADSLRGRLPFLRLADPSRPIHLELEEVAAVARAVRQPLRIRSFTGGATFRDTVRVSLEDLRTAASGISGRGRVIPGNPVDYDFRLEASPLSFTELAWLPVPVPSTGGGRGELRLVTRDGTLAVEASDARFASGDSRASGSFDLRLTEPPRFQELALELDDVGLSLVHELLGREPALPGRVSGTVSGSGPLDLMEVDAELVFRSPGEHSERPSRLRARGEIGLTTTQSYRDLRLELDAFEPRWTRLLGADTRQGGRLSGRVTLDRAPGTPLAFSADLEHRVPGDSTSRVAGRGSVTLADVPDPAASAAGDTATRLRALDVELRLSPLSLSVLDPFFPRTDMVGLVRGTASAEGKLTELAARADLVTPRGEIVFDGRFDLRPRRKAYDMTLTARDIQLRQWMEGGPSTRLDVRGSVQGEGTDPRDLTAGFDLEILPSRFHGARLDSSLLRFTVEEGLATVDTFAIRSDVGDVRGRGGFGLGPDQSGSLILDVDVPDLSLWNRWLVPGRSPVPSDTTARDLFARFRAEDGGEAGDGEGAPPDTLVGSLSARGVVYGNLDSFAFGGRMAGRSLRYGDAGADSLRVTLDVANAASLDSMVLAGTGWGVQRGEVSADSARFRVERRGTAPTQVELAVRRDSTAGVVAEAGVEWGDERKAARFRRLELLLGELRLTLEEPARLAYGDSGLSVEGLTLAGGDGSRIGANGTIPDRGEARFDLTLERVNLAQVGGFLALKRGLEGRLDGQLRVRGTASEPTVDARWNVDAPGFEQLDYGGLVGTLRYADRHVAVSARVRGRSRDLLVVDGGVRADLSFRQVERRLLDDPLDLRVRADSLPAHVLQVPVEAFREVEGAFWGQARVTGSPDSPQLDGQAELRDASARVLSLGTTFRNVHGHATFRGSQARLDSLRLSSGREGTARVEGAVSLAEFSNPGLDLRVSTRRFLAIDRRKASLLVDGSGSLTGSYGRPTLTGRFRLSRGTIRTEEFARERRIVDLTDPELYGLIDTTVVAEQRLVARARNPFLQNLRADVSLQVGPDLWLRSSQLEVEVTGDLNLRMDRAQGELTAFGPLRLARGSFTYRMTDVYSQKLRISEGRLEFVGTPGVDPNLDITAVHRVRREQGPLVVRARVTGTLSTPRVAFSSEPPLSESDQICVLLFNSPCVLAGRSPFQRGGQQLLGSLGSELVSSIIGGDTFDYLQIRSRGAAAAGSQDGTTGDGRGPSLFGETEVEVGKYLTPELFLSVTQRLGNRLPAWTLEWRFSEDWVAEFRSEYRLDEFAGTGTSNIERDRLWGLFLFREWTF